MNAQEMNAWLHYGGGLELWREAYAPFNLPGGEIFTALQTGVIDATEWVGPYNDLALGLHTVAKYYYYPGWHEPGPTTEAIVNIEAWESLPPNLQAMLRNATRAVNDDVFSEFTARNNSALRTLVDEHGVQLRKLPDDEPALLREVSVEVLAEAAQRDVLTQRVDDSHMTFYKSAREYHALSEQPYLNTR